MSEYYEDRKDGRYHIIKEPTDITIEILEVPAPDWKPTPTPPTVWEYELEATIAPDLPPITTRYTSPRELTVSEESNLEKTTGKKIKKKTKR